MKTREKEQSQVIGLFSLISLVIIITIIYFMPGSGGHFVAFNVSPLEYRTNMLVNPSFEGNYPIQNGIPEVTVADGWVAWYRDNPPLPLPGEPGSEWVCPQNCIDSNRSCRVDYGCFWARPEFVPVMSSQFAYRVHSGEKAQKFFTFGRMHNAGLYQTLSGIIPGSNVTASIWYHQWQCYDYNSCCAGKESCTSDIPYSGALVRIGIDVFGGTDYESDNIVWSDWQNSFDVWQQVSISTIAQSTQATLFFESKGAFDWARTNNDVYVDDASFIQVLPATNTPQPTNTNTAIPTKTSTPTITGTPKATNTPYPTNTPLPPGYQDNDYIPLIISNYPPTPTFTPTPTRTIPISKPAIALSMPYSVGVSDTFYADIWINTLTNTVAVEIRGFQNATAIETITATVTSECDLDMVIKFSNGVTLIDCEQTTIINSDVFATLTYRALMTGTYKFEVYGFTGKDSGFGRMVYDNQLLEVK